jgi:hypothetical protein
MLDLWFDHGEARPMIDFPASPTTGQIFTAPNGTQSRRTIRQRAPRYRFLAQASDAKRRGIPFLLAYEEWLCIWMESGRWPQRGTKCGQYVMSRPGDRGAYEVGNVKICLAEENRAERNRNYRIAGERNHNFGRDPWAGMSPEARAERAVKFGATMSKIASTRRQVYRNGRKAWAHPGDADFPVQGSC